MKQAKYIVSACLMGEHCRYNGEDKAHPGVTRFLHLKKYLALCPEMLAGWGSPRPPVEFHGGSASEVIKEKARVKDDRGRDRTASLMRGINKAVRKVVSLRIQEAILKEKSPSCGVKRVYRDGKLTRGEGLFTHRLREEGIRVKSEEAFTDKRSRKL
jgi:uncharacterized protein YbbK (DUF523 family)